ncbi:Uncharacterized protein dnl_46830 [Desulfonema limicola]|uniref:Uncharacterized protein n=1 Tax=Desulfonema limicola TaxID=45656 RepID=A0A975BB05_9BACT|nr:hypothetical protein [Desulfonema limicola]QTA82309.1 Uncharacterized protein dnl_46830 [Desulfonema limicola]
MEQLITKNDGFADELYLISEKLEQYMENENNTLLQEITNDMNKHPGLIALIFPSALQKAEDKISIEKMRLIYKRKEIFFEFYSNLKLEIARRMADALITPVGMDLQTRLAEFASKKIDEFSETIGQSRKGFMQTMAPQFQELETYKHIPELYEPAYQSMKNEVSIYFETIKELMQGFLDNLRKKASESEPTTLTK